MRLWIHPISTTKTHFTHMQPNVQQNLSSEKSSLRHISRSTRRTWSHPTAEPTKHTNGLGKQSLVLLPPLRLPPTRMRRRLDCTICPSNIATVTRQHIVTPPAATAKRPRKIVPALSANEEKQNTSKAQPAGQTPGPPHHGERRRLMASRQRRLKGRAGLAVE
jgi:hypothetical protein